MRIAAVRTLIAFALALLTIVGPGHAQNVTTTGQIRGRVTDASGQPVRGALITARNTLTGLQRTALTETDGGYVLRLLPAGTYAVSTQMIGMAAQTLPEIRVAIGQNSTANFQLSPQAVQIGALEVTGVRLPVDVTDATVVQSVSRTEIEELPVLGRDFVDFINLSGLVSPDQGETTGGQFSIAGQRASQTNLQIDGVDANNAFFGENRGGSRIPFVFSLESIQEFQVITNGYDVEYGNYSGGIVNVVTRGGTNDLRGSGYLNYRGNQLTGKSFLDTLPVGDYEVTQYAASVSGPIKRDRAFYLVSIEGQRRREPQIPLRITDYDTVPAVAEEVRRFWTALESVYGVSSGESGFNSFQTTNDAITVFGRVDWTLNDQHRLSLRHNFSTYNNEREWDDNFDFIYGASRAETIESLSNSFVTELNSVFNGNNFNVLRFQYSNEGRPRLGSNIRPALIATLSNNDLIGFGGTFVGFNNDMEERKIQIIDNFSHAAGNHTFKIGGNAIFTRARNSFLPPISSFCGGNQGAGVFCFPDIASFEAGLPRSYQFNVFTGEGRVPQTEFDVAEVAVYLQDEWRATPKLTITAGLRHDRQHFADAPGTIVDVERAFGFRTSTAPSDNDNISPRLAIAYDTDGEGRSVLRAGAGYFFGRVPYVIGGNVIGSQRPIFNLTCSGSITEGSPSAPPDPRDYPEWSSTGQDNPTSCRGSAALSGVPTFTVWADNFEFPETFKANVGYERMFGERTRVAVDGIYSRSINLYTVRNLNLRPAQFQLANEDGRNVYTPAALFDPGIANVLGSRIFSNLGDIFANYTDGRAEAWIGTLEVNHRLSQSISLRGSYTYTRSHDNSSYSCCTATEGFGDPDVGRFGPNEIGGLGDEERGWGPSYFARDHTAVFSAYSELPFGIKLAAMWRLQSGRPYTPEVSGDINGDGVRFNDRPFVFSPENLPLTLTGSAADTARARYGRLLDGNSCIGDYVGQIIPRGTCRTPASNQLDMRLTKAFSTISNQRAEIQLDLFNVLNGLGRLNCDKDEFQEALESGTTDLPGWCGWGRITSVSGQNRNLYTTAGFSNNSIQYAPFLNFGRESVVGSNLLLQFQAQLALRYYF